MRTQIAAAVLVVLSMVSGGCMLSTQTRYEDRVLQSRPMKQPRSEVGFRAEVAAHEASTVTVRALKQSFCTFGDEETIERTPVTIRSVKPWSGPVAGVGVLITILALTFDYKYVNQKPATPDPVRAGDLIYLHTAGALAIGQYVVAKLGAGESRDAPQTIMRSVNAKTATCGEDASPGAFVRLTNRSNQSHVEGRANLQGLATFSLASANSGFFQGWECSGSGCVAPEYSITINDANAGLTRALSVVSESQKEKETVEAEYARQEKLAEAEQRRKVETERKELAERQRAYERFREGLSVGDETHCGMVIELKKPIVKVQTIDGEKWFRPRQLFPPGGAACRFVNSEYVEP
jgi:hypothetical protein